jgi:hypothetical protein
LTDHATFFVASPRLKRTMPPSTLEPVLEATAVGGALSTVGGTTTTGQDARRETSAEMLPRSEERGP